MDPSLDFVKDVFYFLCGALLHIMVCSIAPLFLDTILVSSDQERLYFLIFFAISLFISSLPLHSSRNTLLL